MQMHAHTTHTNIKNCERAKDLIKLLRLQSQQQQQQQQCERERDLKATQLDSIARTGPCHGDEQGCYYLFRSAFFILSQLAMDIDINGLHACEMQLFMGFLD
jgi:hypothetical protein